MGIVSAPATRKVAAAKERDHLVDALPSSGVTRSDVFSEVCMSETSPTQTTEFVLRGGRMIRCVAIAIGNEIDRLKGLIEATDDEDEIAANSNDLGLYQAILADMGDPR
jgi:hypothetical protein